MGNGLLMGVREGMFLKRRQSTSTSWGARPSLYVWRSSYDSSYASTSVESDNRRSIRQPDEFVHGCGWFFLRHGRPWKSTGDIMYDMYTPPMVQVRHKPVVYDLGSSGGICCWMHLLYWKETQEKETSKGFQHHQLGVKSQVLYNMHTGETRFLAEKCIEQSGVATESSSITSPWLMILPRIDTV